MLINDASITGSLIVNASASLQNISLGGNIIPDETNLRNLGSTDKYFKEIYVSTGSINFVDDGTIVAVLNSDTLGALQNNTASANSRLAAIENFTSSLDTTYTTDAELNASSSTLQLNINTKLNSSSFNSFTSSATARLNSIEATTASFTTIVAGINVKTGSYATTGSNSFNGNQTITGSLVVSSVATISSSYVGNNSSMTLNSGSNFYIQNGGTAEISGSLKISGSLNLLGTTNLATTGSNTFYGTQIISGTTWIAGDFIVQGSSSIQNITGSSINIGTNIINVNTANPAVRYAGLSVQDSGSANGVTGSLLWDSTCNRWIYSNPSTIGYSGGMLLSGPRAATLGTETTLTCNYVAKSGGGDHLYDSCIWEMSGSMGINTSSPAVSLHVDASGGGIIRATRLGSGAEYIQLEADGTNGTLTSSNGLLVNTGGSQRVNITSTGIACFSSQICVGGNMIVNGGTLLMNCDTTTSSDARINFYTKSSSTGDRVALYGYNLSATTTNCEISYQAFGYCTLNNQGYINFQTKNTSGWCNTMYLINGRVGIGVANPSVKLQIDGSLTLKSSSNQSVQIWNDGSVGANIGGNLEFRGTYRNSDNDSVIYGKIFGGKENSSDGNFAGYLSFSTYEYPNSLAERLRISSSGIACFSNTICSANLSTSGFLKAHNSMKTFVVEKNLDERLSNSNYFRMTSSSGGFQVIVYSFSQNVGVGWSGSQIFQAVSAPYWGGWVGSSANVSQIGGESGVISSAVIGNDGTITFRVNTGNNGTNTQGTIRSYIQVNAFNIDGVTLTAL